MNLNKAMLIGNLTRDPELKNTPSGIPVATFGVATNFVWTDQSGQRQEKVEFHNIVAWRRLGEICGQYLRKGSKVYIEGRLQTRDWVGQDGVKRYRTEIIADNMIMLDRAGSAPAILSQPPASQPSAYSQPSAPVEPTVDVNEPAGETPTDDDIKLENIPF
jgi:single-strand DNA-binding protein